MRREKETLNLECNLTNDEKLKYSKELAENIGQKQRCDDSLISYRTQAKAEIAGHDAKINLLSEKISTGREYRAVECRIEYDWENKTRSWIRTDTGEIVRDDVIPEKDLQEEMSLNTGPETEQEKSE